MRKSSSLWDTLRKDRLALVLVALILVALVPVPFLAFRVFSADKGGGQVVATLPTVTSTPTTQPTATATATPAPTKTPQPTATPTPIVGLSPLTGLAVDPERQKLPPIVMMIPSDSEQYGLSQASVVYETVAEYSIPRFMGIFEQMDAEQLGPVRSARKYYVEWACPYGALYTHAGGSPQALDMLATSSCVYNLDGLVYEGSYFWRGVDEVVPWNNLFTNSDMLSEYLQSWELPRINDYQGYQHKDDAPLASRPMTGTIYFEFSYSVRYTYDRENNDYLREYKGHPHLDMLTGLQHRVKNIVIIFTDQSKIADDPKGRMEIETTGEGEAWFFRDGAMIRGTWSKAAPEAEMHFSDEKGQEIAFNRGNIWIEGLNVGQEVSLDLGKAP